MDAFSLPDDHTLLHLQQMRQRDSDWVLKRINLWPTLQRYGTPYLVGAKALGLMMARDIDLTLVVSQPMQDAWTQLSRDLMLTPHVRKVTAIDYYNYDEHQRYAPANGQRYSYYISMDKLLGPCGDRDQLWECQIHLRAPHQFDAHRLAHMQQQLTPDIRMIILGIKYWVHAMNTILQPLSHNNFKIPSPAIYAAVLDGGVRSIVSFAATFQEQVPERYRALYDAAIAVTDAGSSTSGEADHHRIQSPGGANAPPNTSLEPTPLRGDSR